MVFYLYFHGKVLDFNWKDLARKSEGNGHGYDHVRANLA